MKLLSVSPSVDNSNPVEIINLDPNQDVNFYGAQEKALWIFCFGFFFFFFEFDYLLSGTMILTDD